ncbi:MAG: spore coat protein [Thermacetogeniaceae bacterium]
MNGNIRLSDQLCAQDILSSQKFLSSLYCTALLEASNLELRRDLMEIQRQEQDAEFRAFSCMNQKGWYRTSPADMRMINEARAQAQQISSQIGFGYRQEAAAPSGYAPGYPAGTGPGAGMAGGGYGYQAGPGPYGGGFGYHGGPQYGAGHTGYQTTPGGHTPQAGGGPGYTSTPSFETSRELSGMRFDERGDSRRDDRRTSVVAQGDTRIEERTASPEMSAKEFGSAFERSAGFEERTGFPGGTSGQGRRA